jgi:hypothetical protein
MPVFRVTIGWHMSSVGFSETLVTKNNVAATSIRDTVQELLTARAQLLWQNQEFDGVRVSDLGDIAGPLRGDRKGQFLIPGQHKLFASAKPLDVPIRGGRSILPPGDQPDQANAVLHLRCSLSNGTQKMRYLGGIPDNISIYEPAVLDLSKNKNWSDRLDEYIAILIKSWGVLGRKNDGDYAPRQVTQAVLQAPAPALLGVRLLAATAPALAIGDQVHLKGFRMCRGISKSLNKKWYVDSIVTDVSPGTGRTIYLKGSEGYLPSEIKVLGTLTKVGYGVLSFEHIEAYRVRTHKRGRPLGSRVGRRKTPLSVPC